MRPTEKEQEEGLLSLNWLAPLLFATLIGVLGWGVSQITAEINVINMQQSRFNDEFRSYVVGMERRVSALEESQRAQDRRIDEMNGNVRKLEDGKR